MKSFPASASRTANISFLLRFLAFAGRRLRRTPLTRVPLLDRIHARLSLSLHNSNEAIVGPFHLRFDPRDRLIAKRLVLYGKYEEREIEVLCSLVKYGDYVLDVGANIGLHTMYLSRAVGPQGRVIAVEPDPDNLALLKANIEANKCENVIILPCAFGEATGHVDLFQVEDNRGHLSLADLGETGQSVSVPMQRGEEALEQLGLQPTVAKIDVEGAEPLVVSGLGRHKPNILIFEFAPQHIRALGRDPKAFLDSLVTDGYGLELMDPDTGERSRATPSSIMPLPDGLNVILNVLATR
jgi:FkbM family methyltransferase